MFVKRWVGREIPAFEGLELCDGKLSRTVLRGRRAVRPLATRSVLGTMVTSSNFRDKIITGISIKYVWDGSLHYALITVGDSKGYEQTYKLDGLLEFAICDDFGTMHVSQVKLLNIGEQIYLSLDPYDELSDIAEYEKDNIWFQFTSLTLC